MSVTAITIDRMMRAMAAPFPDEVVVRAAVASVVDGTTPAAAKELTRLY